MKKTIITFIITMIISISLFSQSNTNIVYLKNHSVMEVSDVITKKMISSMDGQVNEFTSISKNIEKIELNDGSTVTPICNMDLETRIKLAGTQSQKGISYLYASAICIAVIPIEWLTIPSPNTTICAIAATGICSLVFDVIGLNYLYKSSVTLQGNGIIIKF